MTIRGGLLGRIAASLKKTTAMLQALRVPSRQTNDELRRKLEQSQTLRDINVAIASTLDVRAILNTLLDKLGSVFPNAATTIRLLNRHTGVLEPVGCRNLDEDSWRRTEPTVGGGEQLAVALAKEPVLIEDCRSDSRIRNRDFIERNQLVSYVGIPLLFQDGLLGTLGFFTREKRGFKPDEIDYLATLGSQAAIAIHNAWLYDEATRRADEITALHTLTEAASQSLERHKVLNETVKKIREIFRFEAIRLYLFNPSMEELRVEASFETKPELRTNLTIRRGDSIVGKAAETGETFVFEDVLEDPRYTELSQTESSKKAGARFLAVIPIKSRLRIWGVLVCVSEQPQKLRPGEISLLTSMTNQVGIAVENATLFEETAARAAELSALYAVTAVAGESLDLGVVIERTTDKILEFLGFDGARIYLLDGARRKLHLAAQRGIADAVPLATEYQMGDGRVGRVAETGEPLFTQDMRVDPYYLQHSRRQNLLQAGFRSSCLIPITGGGEILGVMNFVGKSSHRFSEQEMAVLHAVAYHIGAAVRNANLYAQLERKNDKLQKADKAKEEFLGVVSHELRTPLNIISGYTDLILNGVFGELSSEQQHALRMVGNQNLELLNMITSVLQAAKVEADTVFVITKEVDLHVVLQRVKASFTLLPAGKEALTIAWECSSELPVMKIDEEKLRIILNNLIHNAIKFTDEGGVTISVSHRPEAESVEFKISDTGVGIAEDKLPIIFDRFKQVDSSTTRNYGGVGLGLFIVKKFTELLGGSIAVQSKLGEGSTFTVALPINSKAGSFGPDERYEGHLA